MISATKIILILNKNERPSPQLLKLVANYQYQFEILYINQLDKPSEDLDSGVTLFTTSEAQIQDNLKELIQKSTLPTLILFADEVLDPENVQISLSSPYFEIKRSSELNFKLGYLHSNKEFSNLGYSSSGLITTRERRLFSKDSEMPIINQSDDLGWVISNPAKTSKNSIINYRGTVERIQARTQQFIDNPLAERAWNKTDFLDLCFRKLNDKNYKESLWAAEKLVEIESSNFAMLLAAWIAIKVEDKTKLIENNNRLNALLKMPESAYLIAECALGLGHRIQAIKVLEEIINKLPNYALIHQRLGRLTLEEQKIEIAKKHLETCLKYDPKNPIALLDLSQILLAQNNLVASEQLIDRALENSRCEPRAYLQKAFIYRNLKDVIKTLESLEQFLEIEMHDPEAVASQRRSSIVSEVQREVQALKSQI